MNTIKSIIKNIVLVAGLSAVAVFAQSAWVGPTATPPGNNTPTPINVSSISQTKIGGLWVGSLGVSGGATINGSVGIGTAIPDAKLEVNSASSGGGFAVYQAVSGPILRLFDDGRGQATADEVFRVNRDGNVGIGTNNPQAKLDIAGQIKITGGSPGSGKILTSDATGVASWQSPIGGGACTLLGQFSGNTGNYYSVNVPSTCSDTNGCLLRLEDQYSNAFASAQYAQRGEMWVANAACSIVPYGISATARTCGEMKGQNSRNMERIMGTIDGRDLYDDYIGVPNEISSNFWTVVGGTNLYVCN